MKVLSAPCSRSLNLVIGIKLKSSYIRGLAKIVLSAKSAIRTFWMLEKLAAETEVYFVTKSTFTFLLTILGCVKKAPFTNWLHGVSPIGAATGFLTFPVRLLVAPHFSPPIFNAREVAHG